MKIIRLEAENLKRLKAVAIKPDGSLVRITGLNGQGKSSVLDAITMAFGGKDAIPSRPIRNGETKARILAETEDLIVERRFTQKDSYLEVRKKDGSKVSSPQALLDKLTGALCFDPLDFYRLEPKKQLGQLRQLVGVDTRSLDEDRQRYYDARTEANRELAAGKARLSAMPVVNAPDEEVSLSDLLAEQDRLAALKANHDRWRAEAAAAVRSAEETRRKLTDADARVERLKAELAAAEQERSRLAQQLEVEADSAEVLKADADKLVDPDLSAIRERIRNVEETNRAVRSKKARAEVSERVTALEAKVDLLSASIKSVDAEKEKLLAAAKFPIAGLSFDESGITFNGVPLEQASAAEKIRISVAIGLALNPTLRVLLIRDASLLDEHSLSAVAAMAEEADAQVWVEMVGDGAVGIRIDDGEVVGGSVGEAVAG